MMKTFRPILTRTLFVLMLVMSVFAYSAPPPGTANGNVKAGADTTESFLKDEQLPLKFSASEAKVTVPKSPARALFIIVIVLAIAGGGTVFALKTLKQKGVFKGTRRFLIEQLSYCPLGGKAGVSLLKVGNEFVLVGVTQSQVTMLSHMAKLEAQYAEDAQLERSAFKEAVQDELGRLGVSTKGIA